MQCTASLPGGSGQCNSCNECSECHAGPVGRQNRAHRPGGTGSPAQGVVGVSCRACGDVLPGAPAWGDGESCPGGGRSVLQGLWGCTTVRTGLGGCRVHPSGWSGHPSGPMGGHHLRRTGCTSLGGDGESSPGGGRSLLQGPWGASIFREPGAPACGEHGVLPRDWPEHSSGRMGRRHLRRTGRARPGGPGSPAQGVFGASCNAHAEPSSSNNREHRPGGAGSPAQGLVGASSQANGGPSASENGAHRPVGDRGGVPRGCSELSARSRGGHLLQRTGRTRLEGTGSPAQGVFVASCKAYGGPFLSET